MYVGALEVEIHVSAAHSQKLLDQLERFIWSHPEIEVISIDRHWVETGDRVG